MPAAGLTGDGAENSGGAPQQSAVPLTRPQNSWDPVDGTTDHQVGVGTFLAGRKYGAGLGSSGVEAGGTGRPTAVGESAAIVRPRSSGGRPT